jgi:hypothetical protein
MRTSCRLLHPLTAVTALEKHIVIRCQGKLLHLVLQPGGTFSVQ